MAPCFASAVHSQAYRAVSVDLIELAVFGGLFGWAGSRIQNGEEVRGFKLATTSSAALMAAMGYRFFRSRRVMPSGMLAALGAASTAYHALKWQEWEDN